MEKIIEIASHISTPLALAGLFAAVFFFTVRQIISRNIFPELTAHLSSNIIKLIIERLFVLSLLAMVLGFCGYVAPFFIQTPQPPPLVHSSEDPVRKHGTFTVSCDRLDMCADFYVAGNKVHWHNGVCGLPTDVPGGPSHTPTVIKSDDWKEAFPWNPKWPAIERGYRCQNCWSDFDELPYPILPSNITITNVRVVNPKGQFRIESSVPFDGPAKAKGTLALHFRAGIGTIGPVEALIVWDGTTDRVK